MNFNRLKNALDTLITEYNTPGVDCIVYKEHKEVFRCFAGKNDLENNIDMTGKEQYIIFSMTKMLTCTCALQLFEQGKFLMDDEISKYLPEFEHMRIHSDKKDSENIVYATNPITVKHLFTMCAGLDYNLGADNIREALATGKKTTREIIGAMSKTILGFEPGTKFNYSFCHDVLGALIEVWSGMKFSEYMKKYIFEPLNMKNTFFGVPKDSKELEKIAPLYGYDNNRIPQLLNKICYFNFTDEYESGGAGLISSTEDYAIFLDSLANGGVGKSGKRILQVSSVELMRTNQLRGQALIDFSQIQKGYGYGLGVRTHISPEESGSLSPIGEFGWDGAAGAFSLVDLKNRLSLTYFQHVQNWDVAIQNKLRNALYESLDAE